MKRRRNSAARGTGDADPVFARAMQQLGVAPIDGSFQPSPEAGETKKPLGRRHRRPLRADEVTGSVADEDAALFAQAMAGLGIGKPTTKPLPPEPEREAASAPPALKPAQRRQAAMPATLSAEDRSLFAQAMANLNHAPDKDQRRQPVANRQPTQRNSRAPQARQVTVDDQLDLHRERQERALDRLRDFLVGAAVRGLDCVLIVTGKGHHSEGGQGVLRQAVEGWLIRNGTPWVEHFTKAPRELGGRGAWLLRLRK